MICAQCGHENTAGANFCSSCGTPLWGREDDATAAIPAVEGGSLDATEALTADLPPGVAMIIVRRGPNAGSTFRVEGAPITAGRHPDSDMFLDDITVSRRHAVIEPRDSGFAVRDVGSLNGTYVNHRRVEDAPLEDGDELQIGRYVLSFHTGPGGRR